MTLSWNGEANHERRVGPSVIRVSAAHVIAGERRTWAVREVYDPLLGRSLVFTSEGIMRRVRDYPAGWELLSDDELLNLCRCD
jgi:hypothetical protein